MLGLSTGRGAAPDAEWKGNKGLGRAGVEAPGEALPHGGWAARVVQAGGSALGLSPRDRDAALRGDGRARACARGRGRRGRGRRARASRKASAELGRSLGVCLC